MLKFILLGALQGVTEFLPVSSSGHLVIAQHFLGMNRDILFLDTLLHVGTIFAVITFFAKDILAAVKNLKTVGYIAAATLLTGTIGLTLKHTFESFFESPRAVSLFLIANGLILTSSVFFKERKTTPDLKDSLIFGLTQGIAITPGISRSGSTISALLARGVAPGEAFRFSFLASIPAILGAFCLEAKDISWPPPFGMKNLLVGILVSYLFGIIALAAISKIIMGKKFHLFGIYCVVAGAVFFMLIK